MTHIATFIATALFSIGICTAQTTPPEFGAISPDGTLAVSVDTRDGLAWEVTLDGQPLLARSTLGLTFKDGLHLGVHSTILGIERTSHNTTWTNPFGKCSVVRDHFNETRIHLRENPPSPAAPVLFDLIVHAYDDGIALRYDLPAQKDLAAFTLTTDQTAFTFSGSAARGAQVTSEAEQRSVPQRLGIPLQRHDRPADTLRIQGRDLVPG